MDENTLTYELGGQVDIKTLSDGFRAFYRLVDALTPKSAGIAWIVDDLQAGSATVTLRGESESASAVKEVIERYYKVGTALADDEDLSIGFDADTQRAANSVRNLAASTSVEYARFGTMLDDVFIYGNGQTPGTPTGLVSVGVITGTVQTLSNRSGLRFTIYDSVHDKGVRCYLEQGQEELIRDIWGRRASVSGTIHRDGLTGIPKTVTNVLNVEALAEVEPGSYRNARGVVPWKEGDRMPEDVIRESRNTW